MQTPSLVTWPGSLADQTEITIAAGNNDFGTKTTPAPVKWDNFTNGTNGNRLNQTTWPVQTAKDGTNYPSYSTTQLRVAYRTSSLSCKIILNSENYGCDFGYAPANGNRYWYVTYWRYDYYPSGTIANFKRIRIYGDGVNGPNSDPCPESSFTVFSTSSSGDYVFGIWGEDNSGTSTDNYDNSKDRIYSNGSVHPIPPFGTWSREEYYWDIGTRGNIDGFCKRWINATLIETFVPTITWLSPDPFDGTVRYPRIGHYLDSSDTLISYFSEAYIDNTQARVELGNASTWADCTHREIQIPSAWATGSITATVNRGSFGESAQCWLYVVDSDGNVNASGYPVIFGEGGSVSLSVKGVRIIGGSVR